MRKIFFVFSIIALLMLVSSSVFASAPAPSPKCYIEGTIQSVEFKEAYDEPCLTEKYGCPTDMELNHPARYFFKIKIDSVSYVSGETDFVTCDNMLPLNTEHTIFINKDKVKSGDSFESGQKISGQVSSFGGKSFDSYELEKSITDDKDAEPKDSDAKTIIYILIAFAALIVLILIIYFLRKNKK
jgi:hypothetical protein